MSKTLTVIVPGLNEEANIENTVNNIISAIGNRFDHYELLLVDDGSTDQTGVIMDRLAKNTPAIKTIHNEINRGFGFSFNKGVELAKMDYVVTLPGDNEIHVTTINEMFRLIGTADIIIPYTVNTEVRPLARRLISSLHAFILNLLFQIELFYYSGPAVYRRENLRNISIKTNSFAFISATLIQLILKGHSFVEVPMYLNVRTHGKSKAITFRNITATLVTIIRLLWEVKMSRRKETYNRCLVTREILNN